MQPTKKLFLAAPFLTSCQARILAITEDGIVCDQTVAFPEGGGQEGDRGTLIIVGPDKSAINIPFFDTQKGIGRLLLLPDFPSIHVDTPIIHKIAASDLRYLNTNQNLTIKIDIMRRAQLTLNHTGLHLVLMGLEELRPTIASSIKGCHITSEYGRLDFHTQEKFTPQELEIVTNFVNNLIAQKAQIKTFPHSQEPEAQYWECAEKTYPCGGTHIPNTKYLTSCHLQRKNLGRNLERIIAFFPKAELPLTLFYHQENYL